VSKVRNHVHYIFPPTGGVAKGTEEIEQKAKAEVKQPDPIEAKKKIEEKTIGKEKIGF
jgi:hypothetical protein